MKKFSTFFAIITLLLSLQLPLSHDAQARFGGGHSSHSSHSSSHSSSSSRSSFSWGSRRSSSTSHYSSSNTDDNGFTLFSIILFVLIVLYILWIDAKKQPEIVIHKSRLKHFDDNKLISFKQRDQHFSRILFFDFVQLLYVNYYSDYGKSKFNCLTPYLDEAVQHDKKLDVLIAEQVIVISEIVINSMTLHSIDTVLTEERIVVDIEANYTVYPAFYTQAAGKQKTRYALTERWFLQRAAGVLSPAPEKLQALLCPACGAPAHFTDVGECGSCHTLIVKGQQHWYVKERYVLEQTVLSKNACLVSYAQEQGTALETLSSANLLAEIAHFESQSRLQWADYWHKFQQEIVRSYFLALNAAWTAGDLSNVRHLISDRLYEVNDFWMNFYQQHGLRNRLDALKIEKIHVAKIEIDMYYQAITVRIFASCFDYTQDESEKVLGGSRKKRRVYSEYWTFARRADVEISTAAVNLTVCPQCAAPADKMGQSAVCEYCGAKISTGAFSWVLFLITQDEDYQG